MNERTKKVLWVAGGFGLLGAIGVLAAVGLDDDDTGGWPPDDDDDDGAGGDGTGGGITGPGDISPGDVGDDDDSPGVITDVDFPPVDDEPPLPPTGPIPPGGGIDLGEWRRKYPTPGALYQVSRGDTGLGTQSEHSIAYRALLSAGFLAARTVGGQSIDESRKFGLDLAARYRGAPQRRIEYWQAIQCSGFNDAAYGTFGFGDKAMPAPSGRAIRLLPSHKDTAAALKAGRPIVRNIDLHSGRELERANKFELLWLPELDLQAIWDNFEIIVTEWNPPFSWRIETIEDLAGVTFGCRGGEITLTP